jgi:hypothetical protein
MLPLGYMSVMALKYAINVKKNIAGTVATNLVQ